MKRLKQLKSEENMSPKGSKRNLAAELEGAADTDEKAGDTPRTPRRKRTAPEEKDGKSKKAKPASTCEDDPKDEEGKGEEPEDKPKKKYPRGSPGKIKKITDRGMVEGLESQTKFQMGITNHINVGRFFIQHAGTSRFSEVMH